jgi:predicted transcriptional regulator
MKAYIHKTGTRIQGYNSHKEHCFYEDTTKREMFLIIEQMSEMLRDSNQDWVDKALEELNILKINGIK